MPRYTPSELFVVYSGPIPYGDSRPSADDIFTDRSEAQAVADVRTTEARCLAPHANLTYGVVPLEVYFSELYSAGCADGAASERDTF